MLHHPFSFIIILVSSLSTTPFPPSLTPGLLCFTILLSSLFLSFHLQTTLSHYLFMLSFLPSPSRPHNLFYTTVRRYLKTYHFILKLPLILLFLIPVFHSFLQYLLLLVLFIAPLSYLSLSTSSCFTSRLCLLLLLSLFLSFQPQTIFSHYLFMLFFPPSRSFPHYLFCTTISSIVFLYQPSLLTSFPLHSKLLYDTPAKFSH